MINSLRKVLSVKNLLPLFVFVLCFILIPKYSFETVEIQGVRADINKQEKIFRVYHDKELQNFTDYYGHSNQGLIKILDKEIWGFCTLKPEIELKIKDIKIKMLKKDNLPNNCENISKVQPYNSKFYPTAMLYIVALQSLIVSLIIFYLTAWPKLLSMPSFKTMVLNGALLTILFYWFATSYPALFDYDLIGSYHAAKNFDVPSWFSFVYSLFVILLFKTVDHVAIFLVFSSGCILVMFNLYLKLIQKMGLKRGWKIFPIILVIIPPIGLSINFISRDLFSCYLHLILAFGMAYLLLTNQTSEIKKVKAFDLILLFISIVVLFLRREALICSVVFYIFYFFRLKMERTEKVKALGFLMIVFFSFNIVKFHLAPDFGGTANIKFKVSFSHTIGYLLNRDYKSQDKQQDLETLSKYYHVDKFYEFPSDTDVPASHNGLLRTDTHEGVGTSPLIKLVTKMIFDNPALYLKSRLTLFYHTFFGTTETYIIPDFAGTIYSSEESLRLANEINFLQYSVGLFGLNNDDIEERFRDFFGFYREMYNFTPSLLVLTLSLCLFFWCPLSATISTILIVRLIPFFFLLPSSYFKYFFDLYLGGLLLIPILVFELRKKYMKSWSLRLK